MKIYNKPAITNCKFQMKTHVRLKYCLSKGI